MLDELKRRQTLASFDHQWGEFYEGDAMLSDAWFRENVERILTDELLCVDRSWFAGRTVLDAGCGMGRWTLGFLRLGCRVLSVDASERALGTLNAAMRDLAPEAVAEGRLETRRVDLLDLPADLRARRFDLVFSFGVLHHTGDTKGALDRARPARDAGRAALPLPLRHRARSTCTKRIVLATLRYGLAPLPFRWKERALGSCAAGATRTSRSTRSRRSSTTRTSTRRSRAGCARSGFPDVTRTIDYTELYLRARRRTERSPAAPAAAAALLVRALPARPLPPPAADEDRRRRQRAHRPRAGACRRPREARPRRAPRDRGPVLDAPGIEVRTRPLPGEPAVRRPVRAGLPARHLVVRAGRAARALRGQQARHHGDRLRRAPAGRHRDGRRRAAGAAPRRAWPALERRATRRLLEEADLILAKSDALRSEIAAFGRFESKIETVRWGVDPELFQRAAGGGRGAARAARACAADDRVVLSPRLLRPLYNVHLLVEAMPRVLAQCPRALLLLSEHRADEDYGRALRGARGRARPRRPRPLRRPRIEHAATCRPGTPSPRSR